MSFDYDKVSNKTDEGTFWASYSDLFMVLSVVFLLLYVTSSLKQGFGKFQHEAEYNELVKEIEDLRDQLKSYEVIGKDYVAKDASEKEKNQYKDLMDHLSLLETETKNEKSEYLKKIREADGRKKALNQYQRMIKSIVNTNLVAKARIEKRDQKIKKRDKVIKKKNRTIFENKKEISENKRIISKTKRKLVGLEYTIENKNNEISENEQRVLEAKQDFELKVSELKKKNEDTKKGWRATKRKISRYKNEMKQKIEDIKEENKVISKQVNRVQFELDSAANKLETQKQKSKRLTLEKVRLAKKYQSEKDKMSAKFKNKNAESKTKIASLSKSLKAAKERERIKKVIITKIKQNFKKAGVKVSVDKTGEVLLTFGDEYFKTGKHSLKPKMKDILNKFIPLYTKSLFKDKKIARKIKSVDIIGFASPTFKGKYIDPTSLEEKDKKALKFNLDLSYKRAKSIFSHVFDTKKLKFTHQKILLKLVKVSGKSYFSESGDRGLAETDRKHCANEKSCKKSQRVIIKFNLKNE